MDREKIVLLLRKLAIAFGIGFALAVFPEAPEIIDAIEAMDWSLAGELAWALLWGAAAAGLRALLSLLTAFVPTDALHGLNLLGKWRDEPVVVKSQPPTEIAVDE